MRTSTTTAKGSKQDEKAHKDKASPTASRTVHASKPASKSTVPPKRPLTTPRAPSFADRSRPNTSNPDVPSQRPGSRLNHVTNSSQASPRQSPRAPPVTQSRTNPRALPSNPKARPEPRDTPTKRNVTSPASVKENATSESEHEPVNEVHTEDHDAVLMLRKVADRKDDEIAELRGELAEQKASAERSHKESMTNENRCGKLESELKDAEAKLLRNEEDRKSVSNNIQNSVRSKASELEEVEERVKNLKDEIKALKAEKDKELRDADRLHAQQLKEAAVKLEQSFKGSSEGLERELRNQISARDQELKAITASYEERLRFSDAQKQKHPDQHMVNRHQEAERAAKEREEDLKNQLARAQADNMSALESTTKELEKVRQSLGEIERDNSNHEEEMLAQKRDYERRLEEQSSQSQQERKDLEKELQSKTREISEIHSQYRQESNTVSEEITRLADEKIRLENIMKNTQDESRRSQDEARSMANKQLSEAQAQIRRLEEASLDHEQHFRNTVQKNRTDQEHQLKQHEQKMFEAQQAQEELQQSLELAQAQTEELQSKQRELEATGKQNKTELEEILARRKSQEAREQHAQEELHTTRNELDGLKDRLVQNQKLTDESDARQKIFDESSRQKDALISETDAKIRHLETDAVALQSELDGAHKKQQELESLISQSTIDLATASREKETLTMATDASSKAMEEALIRETNLLAQVDEDSHSISTLKAEITNLKHSLEQKLREIDSLQAEFRAKAGVQASTTEEAAMRHAEAIKVMEDQHLHALKHENDAHQHALAEITALQTAIKSIEDDSARKKGLLNAQQRQEVASLRSETEAALKANEDLRQKLAEQNRAREAAEQLASEFEGQVKEAWTTRSKKLEGLQRDHETALRQLSELQIYTADLESKAKETGEAAIRDKSALCHLKLQHSELVQLNNENDATIRHLECEHARIAQEHATNLDLTRRAHKQELALLPTVQSANRQLLQDQEALTDQISTLKEQHTQQIENLHRELATLKQRLRHLDTAHTEATANARSLAQQLHEAKAHNADTEQLKRQLEAAKTRSQQAAQVDHSELRRHISAMGRQYTTDVADIDNLRAEIAKQKSARELAWQRGAEGRKQLLAELEKVRGQWMGDVRVDGS